MVTGVSGDSMETRRGVGRGGDIAKRRVFMQVKGRENSY